MEESNLADGCEIKWIEDSWNDAFSEFIEENELWVLGNNVIGYYFGASDFANN